MLKNLLFFISIILATGMVLTLFFGQEEPVGLGLNNGRLAPCPAEFKCVSSQSDDPDRRVEPLIVPTNVIDPMAKLAMLLRGIKGVTVVKEEGNYLRARFYGKVLWIKSDLELFYDPSAGVVHVRSASRLGRCDIGANREMVEKIRGLFSPDRAYLPAS